MRIKPFLIHNISCLHRHLLWNIIVSCLQGEDMKQAHITLTLNVRHKCGHYFTLTFFVNLRLRSIMNFIHKYLFIRKTLCLQCYKEKMRSQILNEMEKLLFVIQNGTCGLYRLYCKSLYKNIVNWEE